MIDYINSILSDYFYTNIHEVTLFVAVFAYFQIKLYSINKKLDQIWEYTEIKRSYE